MVNTGAVARSLMREDTTGESCVPAWKREEEQRCQQQHSDYNST